MSNDFEDVNRRILIIDDNQSIHDDFAKIFGRDTSGTAELKAAEALVFGGAAPEPEHDDYQIESAMQGEQGIELVRRALAENRPYSVAFVDVRMPPGLNGIETADRVWKVDPRIQIVICTAFSDYSWKEMRARLGRPDALVVLKKPFDPIEALQLADTLTRKWQRAADGNRHLATLQQLIRDRTNQLTDGQRESDQRQLEMAADVVSTQVQQRLVLENELRIALENRQLTVHYQPLVDVATQRIVSLEALVRWTHPERGPIPPGAFIPVAEESGLIVALGEHVLRTACEQVVAWQREGVNVVPVAVNLSPVQLRARDFCTTLRRVLQETAMSPNRLVLELTESTLIDNVAQRVEDLQGLRKLGINIAVDDFGTGYSGLSYLRSLPIDVLKIDRSFVRHVDVNSVDAAIVSAIVAMAHSLGLHVVAEGVETAAQLRVLAQNRCDVAQGFLFSRAVPAAECKALLTAKEALGRPSRALAATSETTTLKAHTR